MYATRSLLVYTESKGIFRPIKYSDFQISQNSQWKENITSGDTLSSPGTHEHPTSANRIHRIHCHSVPSLPLPSPSETTSMFPSLWEIKSHSLKASLVLNKHTHALLTWKLRPPKVTQFTWDPRKLGWEYKSLDSYSYD